MLAAHLHKTAVDSARNKPLIERINRQHGTYIVDYAAKIGLGSMKYQIIEIE